LWTQPIAPYHANLYCSLFRLYQDSLAMCFNRQTAHLLKTSIKMRSHAIGSPRPSASRMLPGDNKGH
jgi:hypothetical protein